MQVKQVLSWAAMRTGRSVILGDMNSSPMATGLDNYGQATLDRQGRREVDAGHVHGSDHYGFRAVVTIAP